MNGTMSTAIDLFCGCGGISAGLAAAGFEILAGIDVEPKYMATFAHNFPNAHALDWSLSETPPSKLMELLNLAPGELGLLVGGPPCQGFSKNVPRKYRLAEDDKNRLVNSFLDYCEALQPEYILMENVAEMRNGFDKIYSKEVVQRLSGIGYQVSEGSLNAADFGVPQLRRRAFFVATKADTPVALPRPTHCSQKTQLPLLKQPFHVSVWDAIGDLPALNSGEGNDETSYAVDPFSDFQQWARGNAQKVRNHKAKKLAPKQYQRLAALEPGQGLKDLPAHLQVKGGYSGAYGRLTKEMVCRTITRWVFHPGSGRFGHPVDTRLITIREAARIQGFPDSHEFVGSYTQQAGQIGNAVPPLLAQQIAEQIIAHAESNNSKSFRNSSTDSFSPSAGI